MTCGRVGAASDGLVVSGRVNRFENFGCLSRNARHARGQKRWVHRLTWNVRTTLLPVLIYRHAVCEQYPTFWSGVDDIVFVSKLLLRHGRQPASRDGCVERWIVHQPSFGTLPRAEFSKYSVGSTRFIITRRDGDGKPIERVTVLPADVLVSG